MKVEIPLGETRVLDVTCPKGHEFQHEWGEHGWHGYVTCDTCGEDSYIVVTNREPPEEKHPGW